MTKMTVMAVPKKGGPLTADTRDLPEPGRNEVRIRIQACGVCHSDVATALGLFPDITYPRVPGHEVVGVIDALGPDVQGWAVGMRVGVGWFPGSCEYCDNCRRGHSFACRNVTGATGVSRDGGYATHMLARTSAVARMPDTLDAVESAPLLCAGVTTFNALRNSGAAPGDLVAVHGVGGLGHLGIQYAAKMGFRTVAVNRGRDKEALARSLGAHDYIDSDANDAGQALMDLGGAKAIIATVTNAQAMEAISSGLGINGVMMVIGAVGALTVDSLELLRKRASVKGWYSGIGSDSEDALAFSEQHTIRSMNEIYPLAQAQDAFNRMLSGKARFRVVLKV
jgi:alcohol dehydrogenase